MRLPHRLLRLIAVGASLVAGASCQIGVDGSHVSAVIIRVDADPDTLVVGDSTALTVRALNPSYDTVRFDTGGCTPLGVEIRTVSGDVVVPPTAGCDSGGGYVLIVPTGEIRLTFVWRGERGIGAGSDPPTPLAPGVYNVRGFLNANGSLRFGAPPPVWLLAP